MESRNLNRLTTQTELIDGHVHLSEIEHSERAVEHAVKAGVKRLLAVAMNLAYESLQFVQNSGIMTGFFDKDINRNASFCSIWLPA